MESNVHQISNSDPHINLLTDAIRDVINDHIGRNGMAYASVVGILEMLKADIIEQHNAE